MLTDFGGDVSGPILRTQEGGIIVFLLFDRMDLYGRPIFKSGLGEEVDQINILNEGLGCDSGSYIFLEYNQKFCSFFQQKLSDNKLNAIIELPPGKYRVGYEQWETDEANPYEAWRRNLVVWPI